MCIVSLEVLNIGKTKILVSLNKSGKRQFVAYQNQINNINHKNAMILPVINPESIKFHDLTNYPDLFTEVANCFGPEYGTFSARGEITTSPKLEIHSVGSYNISIAKNFDNIKNADRSVFDIDKNCLKLMEYWYKNSSLGFIICVLKTGDYNYHPLGYSHDVGNKVFIPTRHYHGHFVTEYANDWDHAIYLRNINPGMLSDYEKLTNFNTWKNSDIPDRKNPDIPYIHDKITDFEFGDIVSFYKIHINGTCENIDLELPLKLNESCEKILTPYPNKKSNINFKTRKLNFLHDYNLDKLKYSPDNFNY
jgi:hypothetical protein